MNSSSRLLSGTTLDSTLLGLELAVVVVVVWLPVGGPLALAGLVVVTTVVVAFDVVVVVASRLRVNRVRGGDFTEIMI